MSKLDLQKELKNFFPNTTICKIILVLAAILIVTPFSYGIDKKGVKLPEGYYAVVTDWLKKPLEEFTVSAWIKVLRANGSPRTIINQGETAEFFSFYLYKRQVCLLVESSPCIFKRVGAKLSETSTWVHFTGVYDGKKISIYKNGKLIASAPVVKSDIRDFAPLYIGAASPGVRYFKSQLDDVAIWNKALSGAEVQELGNGTSPLKVAHGSLLGLWNAGTYDFAGKKWNNARSDKFNAEIKYGSVATLSSKSNNNYKNFMETAKSTFIGKKRDGYKGVWYAIQPIKNKYVYKYSGGLGTYCAKHRPLAVYAPAVDKTFFTYGGADLDNNRNLIHMVSYYDHKTKTVPRPTALLDKRTGDAHDNPVMAIDDNGHIWIFSTSHGRNRFSFIYRSKKPYDIDSFEHVQATKLDEHGKSVPIMNFSYLQPWFIPGKGFICFFTYYGPGRQIFYMTSKNGINWSKWTRIAHIKRGNYQVSMANKDIAGTAFNYHPDKPERRGVNYRTNLYYIQSRDLGNTWETAGGKEIKLPLTTIENSALIHDYEKEKRLVYMKDLRFDKDNHPVILYLTSNGFASGPENGPRTFMTARWTGKSWEINPAMHADNNYDTGALYLEEDGTWRIIAPTEHGPQSYNPGGEMAMWTSRDKGKSWKMVKQLTKGSLYNHTYARRAPNAKDDFYAFWADGHGRKLSNSSLYFCDKEGNVYVLPAHMASENAKPEILKNEK